MTAWQLVADVGGSNARFARSPGHRILSERRSYLLRDHQSFYSALRAYLAETGGAKGCTGAAIGVAGPVDGDRVTLTNAPWTIEASEFSGMLGGAPVELLNDLQAVALALPYLSDDELSPLGGAQRETAKRRTMIALNVGTGFGAATVIPADGDWIANPGEPGHMTLGALDDAQLRLLRGTRSVEDLLSGRGVVKLYKHLADGEALLGAKDLSGARIFADAGHDKSAQETVRQFSALLGRIAGDLVLAAAAWGGVYLCGSVVNGWAGAGGGPHFRAPFEDKGAMTERMQDVYSGIILRDDAALLGLTYLSEGS